MLSFPVPAPAPRPETGDEEAAAPPLHPLTFEAMPTIENSSRYDLVVEAKEGPGFLDCAYIGSVDLYRPDTLERVVDDFEELLERAGAAPDTRLDQLLPAPRHRPSGQVHDHA
jgi:hypothetical protein